VFDAVSEDAKDLIRHMICSRSSRWSAEKIMAHPWMTEESHNKTQVELNVSGIQTFYRGQKLKKCARSFIASQLSETEIKGLSTLFLKIDKDGDGLLSYEELMNGLNKYTSNYAELKELYNQEFEKGDKINYNGNPNFP
jgi:calcium-dependent protein kinase